MRKRLLVTVYVLLVAGMVLSACAVAIPVEAPAPTEALVATPTETTTATSISLHAGSATINVSGATFFPLTVYTKWNYAYQYVDPTVGLNYEGIHSRDGKKGIIDNTITAKADSANSAMIDFATFFSDKLTNTIVDGEGAQSYPIVGYTYIILHTTSMADCVKAEKQLGFSKRALADEPAGSLGYSVLPATIRDQVIVKYAEVICNGALF